MADYNVTIPCVRHCDNLSHNIRSALYGFSNSAQYETFGSNWKQGFLDNKRNFLTREEAYKVALDAGQVTDETAHKPGTLFSEDLY